MRKGRHDEEKKKVEEVVVCMLEDSQAPATHLQVRFSKEGIKQGRGGMRGERDRKSCKHLEKISSGVFKYAASGTKQQVSRCIRGERGKQSRKHLDKNILRCL